MPSYTASASDPITNRNRQFLGYIASTLGYNISCTNMRMGMESWERQVSISIYIYKVGIWPLPSMLGLTNWDLSLWSTTRYLSLPAVLYDSPTRTLLVLNWQQRWNSVKHRTYTLSKSHNSLTHAPLQLSRQNGIPKVNSLIQKVNMSLQTLLF